MERITVSSQKSSITASTLSARCEQCNGLYGHHGTCPLINTEEANPILSQIFGSREEGVAIQ